MKKIFLMMLVLIALIPETNAKIKAHVEIIIEAEIGRPKKNCQGVWLCITRKDVDASLEFGMIRGTNHGVVIDEDGSLSLAINMNKVREQDITKYNQLNSGRIVLDSEETLPQVILERLGYEGPNTFKAGTYSVSKKDGYFLVHL